MKKKADVMVGNEGTIWTFLPVSERGKRWIDNKVQAEGLQCARDRIVVCHRCAHEMLESPLEDGLEVAEDKRK